MGGIMNIQVGDQLLYTINDYNYCLTVLEVYPRHVVVNHAPPHDDIRFNYYLYQSGGGPATMANLIKKVENGHYAYISSSPAWEV
jgi:hypothetical protein